MNLLKDETILFNKGIVNEFGYAYRGVVKYNIKDGHIPLFRLKEWDFYQIYNKRFSLYTIIGHVSYATSINCTLFDFETKETYYIGKLIPFKKVTMDKNASIDSIVSYKDKNYELSFTKRNKYTYIDMKASNDKYKNCSIHIKLENTLDDDILVLTPFNKKYEFYLNQKRCLMKASGTLDFDNIHYDFIENESFGLLDWGRGVLPFKHEWIWGNGSGIINNHYFGFNIGKFGNNENGSENIIFYDGKSYKFEDLNIEFDKSNYMNKWIYTSKDIDMYLEMTPVYDNYTKTKMLWVDNSCHQIFGNFNGYIVLDNERIEIKDFFAFTEHAKNRW